MPTFLKKIFFVFVFITFTACNTYDELTVDTQKLYPYNTPKFTNWEQQNHIKLEEAYKIHLKNVDNSKKPNGYPMCYAYDTFYIFSNTTNLHKLGKFNLSGIWVHAQTGEVKVMNLHSGSSFTTNGFIWSCYRGEK